MPWRQCLQYRQILLGKSNQQDPKAACAASMLHLGTLGCAFRCRRPVDCFQEAGLQKLCCWADAPQAALKL